MPLKNTITLDEWEEDRRTTRAVYDHSLAKPVSRKNKIKHSKSSAFLSIFPFNKPSCRIHHTEEVMSYTVIQEQRGGEAAEKDR